MKLSRKTKNKHGIDEAKIKTAKMIETQQQKQQFFGKICTYLERQFTHEHFQFLFQNMSNTCHRDYKYQNTTDTEKTFTQDFHIKTMCEQHFQPTLLLNNKKQDINPFELNFKKFIVRNKKKSVQDLHQYSSTPKSFSTNIQKKFPKKLMEVENKMRKHYQRVKQRIIFQKPDDTFRVSNQIRGSLALPRPIKSQRAYRYQTECRESKIQTQQFNIPRILLGDLLPRNSCQEESINEMFRGSQTLDKKKKCFQKWQRGPKWWGRRYKINH